MVAEAGEEQLRETRWKFEEGIDRRTVEIMDAWLMDLAGASLLFIPTRLDFMHQLQFRNLEYQSIDQGARILLGERLQLFLFEQQNVLAHVFL